MKKKIIVKISEGLGNQLFMYAHGYSLHKKYNLDLFVDSLSGYYHKKKVYNFLLDKFNISSPIAPSNLVFDNYHKNFLKKIYLLINKFKKKKRFIFENRNKKKITHFSPLNIENTFNYFYVDGNFESENYFSDYRKDLLNEFKIIDENNFEKNKYLKLIRSKNVVSICIRQNRFSERVNNMNSELSIKKSNVFLKDTIDYIFRSINFFKKQIQDPLFLIWSNDFTNLDQYFDSKEFIFVINDKQKIISDFYLLTQCKYFIVGPSTFHWWGAWLSNFNNKICTRPSNINPSNNTDFWPNSWISI